MPKGVSTSYDYKGKLGADPLDNPKKYIEIVQNLKKTKSYGEIAKQTGIPADRIGQWMRKLNAKVNTFKGGGRSADVKVIKLPDGSTFTREGKLENYLRDGLPKAIRDEAERRGMSVEEFLEANGRGEV